MQAMIAAGFRLEEYAVMRYLMDGVGAAHVKLLITDDNMLQVVLRLHAPRHLCGYQPLYYILPVHEGMCPRFQTLPIIVANRITTATCCRCR